MAYFPFFVELRGLTCLIVGGGTVALRKAERIASYGAGLRVVAPDVLPDFLSLPFSELRRKPFGPEDLNGMDFVIAATDDKALNREIACLCRERGLPVNAVDDKEACTFLFPSLVRKGGLSVGVCTGGASPSAGSWLKKEIEALLPERFDEMLSFLEQTRPLIRERFPQEQRPSLFLRLFERCMEKGGPLSEAEFQSFLDEAET